MLPFMVGLFGGLILGVLSMVEYYKVVPHSHDEEDGFVPWCPGCQAAYAAKVRKADKI